MNKQELQQKIKDMKPPKFFTAISLGEAFEGGFEQARVNALLASDLLDEPEKPVIPKYVADWIEWCKKHKVTLLGAVIAICDNKNIRSLDASGWATKNQETFTKAWFYGYKVEKEKLYTVEIPNPNGFIHLVLCKDCDGKIFVTTFSGGECWKTYEKCKLTETEIKKDFDWAWKFAEVVEE